MLTDDVRFEGWDVRDWQRLLSLFRRPGPRRGEATGPSGGVIAVHDGGRLYKLLHTRVGRLELVGQSWPVTWVEIEDPDRGHTPGRTDGLGVLSQGRAGGGSVFTRLEGCQAGVDRVWLVSTNGGNAGYGQVFAYHPEAQRLELVFESEGAGSINYPDNVTLSPRGGLVLCEDVNRDGTMLWGLSADGTRFPLAENNVYLDSGPHGISGDFRRSEWAGCCFSPDGKWLFANVYKPGITVAITGPWKAGLV